MPRKRHKPEEIVAKLRQVDVLASQGQSVAGRISRHISLASETKAEPSCSGSAAKRRCAQ
jgi:hypothetical protein